MRPKRAKFQAKTKQVTQNISHCLKNQAVSNAKNRRMPITNGERPLKKIDLEGKAVLQPVLRVSAVRRHVDRRGRRTEISHCLNHVGGRRVEEDGPTFCSRKSKIRKNLESVKERKPKTCPILLESSYTSTQCHTTRTPQRIRAATKSTTRYRE